ncbi:MAG: DNA polymerase I [Actinomycetota bacterium]|nr:DNA polymerase I [Actinomycetota bacterium]
MAEELFLIDGNSLAYRAFFALPESIATSTGFPTNAIFGFASMLVKILTDYGPKATVVVWDAGSSGRKEVYEEYKAQRRQRPDLLAEQWPHLEPLVDAFGYRNVSVPGYEADDVIASIVERAKEQDVPVMVVTGDRDAYQLVDDGNVKIMTTSRGITDTRVYDREGVIDRYGIPPELIPDFIGLKGDTSDNIPGVPGIGDKTAAQLLQEFGSLEGVLDNVERVSGAKRKQNLTEHAQDARVSKQLATIVRDIEVDVDPAAELAREPDRSRLREVFRQFELRDPLRRLEDALDAAEAAPLPREVTRTALSTRVREAPVSEVPKLRGDPLAIAARAPEVPADALFVEGQPWRFGAYAGGEEALAGECAGPAELVAAVGERPVAVHDAKSLGTVPPNLFHDTMVAGYLLDPAGRAYPFDELCADRGIDCDVADEVARDAVLVRTLSEWQREALRERDAERLLDEVELPLVHVLRAMELAGVKLDVERLAAIAERVRTDAEALEREIHALAGEEFTIGSPQQLSEVLFVKLGLSRKRRGKTGYSTDARVLAAIRDEHEIIPKIERWRELTKLNSTYLEALPALIDERDGRLHTTFNQTATTTGRLSSTDPNLQNIPIRTELGREIRACFVAEPGDLLVSADYSQVELRVLAHIAGEEVLREIFARGEDVHTGTAGEVLGLSPEQVDPGARSKAKMINYGIVYGLSGFGLADRLQIEREEADAFIERYLDRFPKVREFIERTIASATQDGYVTTLLGRRRRIPELRARNRQVRQLGERLAVNTVIQGSAADIIKVAMVRTHRALAGAGLDMLLVLQIHDELLFEGPGAEAERAAEIVRAEMEGAHALDPPLAVDLGVGPNWLEAK